MKHNNIISKILKCLTLLVFSFYLLPAFAQVGSSFQTNLFVSGKASGVMYTNDNGMAIGFGGGFSIGKWVSEPLALRANIDVGMLATREQTSTGGTTMHLMPSLDAIFDPWVVFGNGPQDWYIRVYPIVGIGGLFRSVDLNEDNPNNVFEMSLGLHIPFSFQRYSKWAGFLEYKYFLLPQHYDGNKEHRGMNSVSLGLSRRFNMDPYHRRTAQESHDAGDDWFAGCGIGVNYSSFDLFSNPNHGGLAMIGVAPEIMVGRNYSNFWTLRIELTGLSAHEQFDTLSSTASQYMFTFAHADLMVNVSHALYFKRGVKWNVLPYIGIGPVWRYDDMVMNMAGNLGIMFRRYLNEAGDFYIDAKYVMVPPAIGGGRGPSGSIYGVGLPSITAGYIYNFGVTSARYRQPASHTLDCAY